MAFSDPEKNLHELGLQAGASVADCGAGSGFYTLAASRMVGEGGSVFAIDVQSELLTRLKNTAAAQHLHNIHFIHGDIEEPQGTLLKDSSVDAVLSCNVLFQTEQKAQFISEIRRILKPTGRVLIVDWNDSFGGLGPQPEHIITDVQAKDLFMRQGFVFIKEFDAGDHHYGLIFRKS